MIKNVFEFYYSAISDVVAISAVESDSGTDKFWKQNQCLVFLDTKPIS